MVRKVLLSARDIHKSYTQGTGELPILKGLNFQIHEGEAVGIVGSSGSGKTTLLQILGTLDRPFSGELKFEDMNLLTMSDEELSQFRNQTMGFVFQFHHLLRDFTALENVSLPMEISGIPKIEARHRARLLLDDVGLRARETHLPSALSGGEQQRVAVARALAMAPKLLLADEPSGNLDRPNAERLHDLLGELAPRFGAAVIAVTHNPGLAAMADRVLELRDGALEAVISVEHSGGFDGRTL